MLVLKRFVPDFSTGFVLLIAAIIAALGIIPFLNPEFYGADVDSSWMWVMNEAFVRRMKWGQDIIWHYGPLGFLYGRSFHPDTYILKQILWAFMAAVYLFGCYSVIIRSGARTKPHLVAIPMLMLLASLTYETVFFSFAPLFLFYAFFMRSHQSKPLMYVLTAALALTALVKISYFVNALVILLIVELFRYLHLKERPVYLLTFFVLFLAGWLLAHQDITLLPSYLRGAFEHANGFSESMQLDSGWSPDYPLFILGAVILFSLMASVWIPQFGKESWAPLLGVAYLFFAASKIGFVQDNNYHLVEASALLILIAVLARDLFWEDLPSKRQSVLMIYCMVLVAVIAFMMLSDDHAKDRDDAFKSLRVTEIKRPEATRAREAIFAQATAKIRKDNPLPAVKGLADMMGGEQSVLLAHGLLYHPRPVFQSYHTYTAYLAEKNRAFLLSDKAPEHVFFRTNAVEGRYPAVEDALSWPVLLSHYAPQKLYGTGKQRTLHLKKRSTPHAHAMKSLDVTDAGWNQPVLVPQQKKYGMIWMRAEVKPTLLNKLLTALYRGPQIVMRVIFADNTTKDFAVMYGTLEKGFLLSPYVSTPEEFKILYDNVSVPDGRNIVGVGLMYQGLKPFTRHLFGPAIRFTFEQVVIRR